MNVKCARLESCPHLNQQETHPSSQPLLQRAARCSIISESVPLMLLFFLVL